MLKMIRLELARSHEFPEGSPNHGYEFTAPLGADGKIDAEEWHRRRELCKVRRFRPGEVDDVAGRGVVGADDGGHPPRGGLEHDVHAYANLDVRLGWHATRNLEFAVTGQNLIEAQRYEFNRNRVGGSEARPVPRSVFANLTWRF